jgi:hypothetical protein
MVEVVIVLVRANALAADGVMSGHMVFVLENVMGRFTVVSPAVPLSVTVPPAWDAPAMEGVPPE